MSSDDGHSIGEDPLPSVILSTESGSPHDHDPTQLALGLVVGQRHDVVVEKQQIPTSPSLQRATLHHQPGGRGQTADTDNLVRRLQQKRTQRSPLVRMTDPTPPCSAKVVLNGHQHCVIGQLLMVLFDHDSTTPSVKQRAMFPMDRRISKRIQAASARALGPIQTGPPRCCGRGA